MRVAVLPRDVAARVITSGIARGAWTVNACNLALTIPILIEYFVTRGLGDALAAPLSILIFLFLIAVAAAIQPRPWVVVAFLAVGAVGAFAYELTLIAVRPEMIIEATYLLNRPAVSLVLVGVATSTWRSGVGWSLAGFAVSTAVSLAVAAVAGTQLVTGWGPVLMAVLYVGGYLVLAGIQRSQRRRVPNIEQLEEETRLLGVEENYRARMTAAIHDTLLNDLSIVMNAPDELDSHATDRLRADIATLTSREWRAEVDEVALIDDQDSELRNELMLLISDFQWRGLTVHITGSGSGVYRLTPAVARGTLDVLRACLENALRHSGTDVVEVDLAYTDTELTMTITDQGVGFDPEAIDDDRLGVRFSILERAERAGGSAKIWSSPGTGTSVVVRMPVEEKLTGHEEPRHGAR